MAKQVDEQLFSGFKRELDMFSLPPTQVAIEKGYWSEYYAQNPVTNTGPYRIFIPKESLMIDLNKNYLYLRVRIVAADGSDLALDANGNIGIAPINQLCKSFRERVILKMNDKEIENCGGLYAYKATTHQQLGMYYKDESGDFNNVNNCDEIPRSAVLLK